ncbi:MFS transporter [Dyella sp. 2RAB6]|uniref:MFS transporter n=1 Tax=Dyella sp. 2RAB6 TaxID=3232992 RepID=UPI003F8EB742
MTPTDAGDPRRWLALPVLLTGAFLPPLDFFIVNVALPSIRGALHASAAQTQFVISAYAAIYAVCLITGGRLGDLFGRRRLFLIGIAGFVLASLLCGLAWSADALLVGRLLQGLAAAALAPQVLASIRVMFPSAEQPRALALYAATFGLAATLGQVLGGVLIAAGWWGMSWQWIFLVNLPVGIAAFAGGLLLLRESREAHAKKLDLGGMALLSLALAALVYPLVEGREQGWPLWTWAMLGGSLALFVLFLRFEARLARRGGAPLVDVSLLRHGEFMLGIVITLGFYLTSAFMFTYAAYLQGLGRDALHTGLATLPFTLGYLFASVTAAPVMQRLGRAVLPLSLAAQAIGFALIIGGIKAPSTMLEAGLIVSGIGFGFAFAFPSLMRAVLGSVDARHAGLASGMVITALQISAALGVAVIGGVFYSTLGAARDPAAYAYAFATGLGCNVVALAVIALLSSLLGRHGVANAAVQVAPEA